MTEGPRALPVVFRAFLEDLSEERAAVARDVHALIGDVAPALLPPVTTVSGPGYGPFRYRYASGREGEAHLITISHRRAHLAVYVNAVEDGAYVAERRASQLGAVSVGRSCIRIRRHGDLDLRTFSEVIEAAVRVGGAGAVSGTGSAGGFGTSGSS